MPQQTIPLFYDPCTGHRLSILRAANDFRDSSHRITWFFNPWTGTPRNSLDIESDRTGLLIIPPGEAVRAS